jgi:RES domain-containing protein
MPQGWRITKRKHLATAWNGGGASLHGGRWNSPGRRVVYTAFSRSLGALESLVHLEDAALVAAAYVALPAEFDAALVAAVGKAEFGLRPGRFPDVAVTRAIGDSWLDGGRTPVLRVPTAVLPRALDALPIEVNYLLNPLHRDFGRISLGSPIAFAFDRRLGRLA